MAVRSPGTAPGADSWRSELPFCLCLLESGTDGSSQAPSDQLVLCPSLSLLTHFLPSPLLHTFSVQRYHLCISKYLLSSWNLYVPTPQPSIHPSIHPSTYYPTLPSSSVLSIYPFIYPSHQPFILPFFLVLLISPSFLSFSLSLPSPFLPSFPLSFLFTPTPSAQPVTYLSSLYLSLHSLSSLSPLLSIPLFAYETI